MARFTVQCPVCNKGDAEQLGPIEGRDATLLSCARCGRFGFDPPATDVIESEFRGLRYILSAQIRRASASGPPPIVTAESVPTLVNSAPPRPPLLERADQVLLYLADHTVALWAQFQPDVDNDYPLIYAQDAEEFKGFITALFDLGYVQLPEGRLTLQGWARVDELRRGSPRSGQAFVAMWFDKDMDSAWVEGFKPGIEKGKRFVAYRVDREEHNERIDDRIIAELRHSGLIVADFTGARTAVYYEAGFAAGLGVPVIWTCRGDWADKLSFDTRQFNHIVWDNPAELRDRLDARIEATIPRGTKP